MTKRWTDLLPGDVSRRLAECRNTRDDVQILVNVKWAFMKERGKDKEGFTKEDALVDILDLLDSNSQYLDLSREEYDALWKE